MNLSRPPILDAFEMIQNCIRVGRKVKTQTQTSLKGTPFAVAFKIPLSISFAWKHEEGEWLIQRMLRAETVHVEDEYWEEPVRVDGFPYFAGHLTDNGITATLWTKEMLWV